MFENQITITIALNRRYITVRYFFKVEFTRLKSLLQFSLFFEADFGIVFGTKFSAYLMINIWDFYFEKILRVIYEKIRDFFVDYAQKIVRKKEEKCKSSDKRQI